MVNAANMLALKSGSFYARTKLIILRIKVWTKVDLIFDFTNKFIVPFIVAYAS